MKSLSKILAFVSFASLSTPAFAEQSLCQAFRAAIETEEFKSFKKVDPAKQMLTTFEKGLIQSTILVGNPGVPVDVQTAIDQFTDKDSHGTNGGDLAYFRISYKNKTRTIVQAVYYPGDNAYGAFYVVTNSGREQWAGLLGLIEDGDIVCLSFD